MTTTDPTHDDALETLAAVARLLCRCADVTVDEGLAPAMSDLSMLGLGAQLLAFHALALLPDSLDVDEPVPVETDPVQLLRAAETLTRAHPIEQFPPGTSQLIVGICDLIGAHAR